MCPAVNTSMLTVLNTTRGCCTAIDQHVKFSCVNMTGYVHVQVRTRDHPELLTFEKSRHRNRLVLAWLHLFWQKNVVQQV